MEIYKLLESLNIGVSWIAVITSIISIGHWVIKIWNTTPLQLLFVPKHKKITHEISMSIIISSMMMIVLFLGTLQFVQLVNESVISLLGNIGLTIYLLVVLFVCIHSLVLNFYNGEAVYRKVVYKIVVAVGLVSLMLLIVSANALITQGELSQQEIIFFVILEFLLLVASFIVIPIYVKEINRTGYYYEIEIIQGDACFKELKQMVFQYTIKDGIQVMTSLDTTGQVPSNHKVYYVYYLQYDLIQKVQQKTVKL